MMVFRFLCEYHVCAHFECVTVELEELLSVHILGSELRDVLLQVQAHEPETHLLTRPVRHTAILPLVLLQRLLFILDLTQRTMHSLTEISHELHI